MYIEETLFLDASKAIDENNLSLAKELLEEILMNDPLYARAHNHLGWLYDVKFKDYDKAEVHYKLAIKYGNQNYPAPYLNYGYLLFDCGMMEQAWDLSEKALQVKGINRSAVAYQKAKICEIKGIHKLAYNYYIQALNYSTKNDFVDVVRKDIKRLKKKTPFYKRIFWK